MGTFTDIELQKIQHPIIQSLLPRLGLNSNMPKAIIYGPTTAGGLGFTPLVVIQATQKIKHILQAYRHHTELQKIFQITFQWAQKVAGISQSIFQNTGLVIPSQL